MQRRLSTTYQPIPHGSIRGDGGESREMEGRASRLVSMTPTASKVHDTHQVPFRLVRSIGRYTVSAFLRIKGGSDLPLRNLGAAATTLAGAKRSQSAKRTKRDRRRLGNRCDGGEPELAGRGTRANTTNCVYDCDSTARAIRRECACIPNAEGVGRKVPGRCCSNIRSAKNSHLRRGTHRRRIEYPKICGVPVKSSRTCGVVRYLTSHLAAAGRVGDGQGIRFYRVKLAPPTSGLNCSYVIRDRPRRQRE